MDVLVNVRPPWWGKDNSAPSKVFEYGVAGKAILSTRTAGMDEILGTEGIYIETDAFEDSLRQRLREVSAMDRVELQRRAAIIRDRIINNYSWEKQSQLIIEFLTRLVDRQASPKASGAAPGIIARSPQRDTRRRRNNLSFRNGRPRNIFRNSSSRSSQKVMGKGWALGNIPVVQSCSFYQPVSLSLQIAVLFQGANAVFNQDQGRAVFFKIKSAHHFDFVAFHVEGTKGQSVRTSRLHSAPCPTWSF